jgi:hypothetical protein
MLQDFEELIVNVATLKKTEENRNRLINDAKIICTNDTKILLKKETKKKKNFNEDKLLLNWILSLH